MPGPTQCRRAAGRDSARAGHPDVAHALPTGHVARRLRCVAAQPGTPVRSSSTRSSAPPSDRLTAAFTRISAAPDLLFRLPGSPCRRTNGYGRPALMRVHRGPVPGCTDDLYYVWAVRPVWRSRMTGQPGASEPSHPDRRGCHPGRRPEYHPPRAGIRRGVEAEELECRRQELAGWLPAVRSVSAGFTGRGGSLFPGREFPSRSDGR